MSKSSSKEPSADLMDVLLKDPAKRALILQIIQQEKGNIEKYKLKEIKEKTLLKKVKNIHCESPTSLQRRRALLKQNNAETSSSSSEISETGVDVNGPKLPFDQLLKGVIAYVEVRRDNTDRSEGIKAVMRLMGATIRDKFTNDVSHVVFKDGSFATFEKAKLMKKHLVSVLWLDAVRRNNVRVSEKNYPAFGNSVCDQNVSILCSQIQKDYEEIIKDEKRRRHTVGPQTSLSSYLTAQTLNFSDNEPPVNSNSPVLTSDDSDCGVIDGYTTKRSRDSDILVANSLENITKNSSRDSSASTSLLTRVNRNKRKTINSISDMSLTPNVINSVINNENISVSSENTNPQSSVLSSLRLSDSDKTKSDLHNSKDTRKTRSSLLGGKENSSLKSVNSTMSSLRLSEAQSKKSRGSKSNSSSEKIISKTPEITTTKLSKKSPKKTRNISESSDSEQEMFFNEVTNSVPKSSTPNKTRRQPLKSTSPQANTKSIRRKLLDSPESEIGESPPKKLDKGVAKSTLLNSNNETSTRSQSLISVKQPDDNKKTNRRSVSKNLFDLKKTATSRTRTIPEESNSETEITPPEKTPQVKKTRKLYNPNELTLLSLEKDEQERDEYLKTKSKKSPDGIFLNPNNIQISSKRTPFLNTSSSDDTEPKSSKSKPKKNGKTKTPPKKSSKQNRELTPSINTQTRRSQRLTLSQSKPTYTFSSSESSSNVPITPIKRRSTLDFAPVSQSQQKRKLKLDPKRITSIVCTKMHRPQVLNFEKIVINLGKFYVEDKVTGKTSHLVAGEPKRTINMLRAIARGCWILKHEWLLKSQEIGKWLNEEDYELTEFSPAVQQCRLQREAFGPLYSMDIFKDCGFIYVGKSTTPKPADLKELISICKGRVTTVFRNAVISVGEFIDREEVVCVNEMWVLDSIHFNKLKSFKNYLLKDLVNKSPEF